MSRIPMVLLWICMLTPPVALLSSIGVGALQEYRAWQLIERSLSEYARDNEIATTLQSTAPVPKELSQGELTWDDVYALSSYYSHVTRHVNDMGRRELAEVVKRVEPYFVAAEQLRQRSPDDQGTINEILLGYKLRDAVARNDREMGKQVLKLLPDPNQPWPNHWLTAAFEESLKSELWELEDLEVIESFIRKTMNVEFQWRWQSVKGHYLDDSPEAKWTLTTNAILGGRIFEWRSQPEAHALVSYGQASRFVGPTFFDVAIDDRRRTEAGVHTLVSFVYQHQNQGHYQRLLDEIERQRRLLE